MSRIKRRQFLQFAGSALATVGLSQWDIMRQGNRYGKVLAQSTSRKLALLVGINEYVGEDYTPLRGCVTDAKLQRELLIHRFGFNKDDIVTLTDAQATRKGILETFDEHLVKQAKPGDVVVFHYSGHGSRVLDPKPIGKDDFNSTLVPIDEPTRIQEGVVDDIMGRTLFLLMSALKTDNVTMVLDSCYSGGGTRGNFRVRSARARSGSGIKPSQTELSYQEQLLSRLNLPREKFEKMREVGVAKGVVIASAQRDQEALDAAFDDFYAGAFTYLLTQYLWQQTGTVNDAIANITRDIRQLSVQVPLVDIETGSGNGSKPLYFTAKQTPPAEAVITNIQGTQADLWLGGLDRESLKAFEQGASFTIIGSDGRSAGQVELQSRKGLEGKANLVQTRAPVSLQPGSLLQEAARAIPPDLKLRIGLDPTLGTQANAAKQALEKIARVEGVPFQAGNVPYEGEIHYILSQMTADDRKAFKEKPGLPAEGSIGLLSPARDELIPGSFGEAGETVSKAFSRLEAKLKALLAARIVKMSLNAKTSRLDLEASMQREGGSGLIAEVFTARGDSNNQRSETKGSKTLPLNAPFQFKVKNKESRDLYLSLLVIDASGGLTVLFPNRWGASVDATLLKANQELTIPDPELDDFEFVTQVRGIGEVLIIASRNPLRKSLLTLQKLAEEQLRNQERGPVVPTVEAMGDLLDDLSGTRTGETIVGVRQRVRPDEMAALSITFEVV